MDDDVRIYKLIEDERKERIEAIAGVHSRLDDIFSVINKLDRRTPGTNGAQASWVRQSVGLTIAVITLIGAQYTITKGLTDQLQLQLNYATSRISTLDSKLMDDDKREQDDQARMAALAEKFVEVETQFEALEALQAKEEERQHSRIRKLEEWQKWWYRTVPERDSAQDREVEHIYKELERVNGLFEIREKNIKLIQEGL